MTSSYYKVRYARKLIKIVLADSKYHAIDIVFQSNQEKYPWIKRSLFTAVINDARSSQNY